MPALLLRPTPGREGDSALVRVLEASIETLRAENEILRRRLAAAEARVARETANAEQAIAEFSAITAQSAGAAACGIGSARTPGQLGRRHRSLLLDVVQLLFPPLDCIPNQVTGVLSGKATGFHFIVVDWRRLWKLRCMAGNCAT